MTIEELKTLSGAETVSKYLAADNARLRKIVGMVACNVTAAAKQAAQALITARDRVSDVADHLDGEFITELKVAQAVEIEEIAKISSELERYFDNTIMELAFKQYDTILLERARDLKRKEQSLWERERDIEQVIARRTAELRAQITRESNTARGFLERALAQAEKVFEQNKITRFAYATISIFQEAFFDLGSSHDVAHIARLYQQAVEPYQITRMVMDNDGKLKKMITNQFTQTCTQDLFMFFYRYYQEVLEIYHQEGTYPPIADELSRIFDKKKKGVSEIISAMHKN